MIADRQTAQQDLSNFRIFRDSRPLVHLPMPIDDLLTRAQMLPAAEYLLVTLYLERRATTRSLGELLGCSAGTLTRRCQRLIRRLSGPLFLPVVRLGITLDPADRRLLHSRFLAGHSVRQLARTSKRSLEEVRQRVNTWQSQLLHATASLQTKTAS